MSSMNLFPVAGGHCLLFISCHCQELFGSAVVPIPDPAQLCAAVPFPH